ncbi:MAG: phosphatidate cytidylyltransferase, partial [Planctomycetota bacterium]
MTAADRARLFDPRVVLDQPDALWLAGAMAGLLAVAPLLFTLAPATLRPELWQRWRTWLLIAAVVVIPILLGAAATLLMLVVVALLCYREYARATGLFRHRGLSAAVVLTIVLTFFAALDNYYAFFVALFPL